MPDEIQEMSCVEEGGAIYVAGGMLNSDYHPTKNFIRYIIAEDRWEKLPDLPVAVHHTSMASYKGKVYIIGGINKFVDRVNIGGISDGLYEYNIATGKWEEKAKLPHKVWAAAVCVYKKKIYVFSGTDGMDFHSGSGHVEETQVYDIPKNVWSDNYAKMPRPRNHTQAVVVGNKAYVSPGRWKGVWDFTDTHLSAYNFDEDSWEEMKSLPEYPRSGGGFARLGDYIYFIGGEGAYKSGCLNKVDAYNYKTNSWERVNDLPENKHGMWAATRGNRIYVSGGAIINGVKSTKKLYAFEVNICSTISPTPAKPMVNPVPKLPKGKWTSLFDGKTLNGWHVVGYGYWCVKDGMIIGVRERPGKGGFLFTDKDTYKDFELVMEVKTDYGCDSGIHLRDVSDGESESGDGYQCCLDYAPNFTFGGFYYKAAKEEFKFWRESWPFVFKDEKDIKENQYKNDKNKMWISPDEWTKVFNPNSWNQIRIRIEGEPAQYQCWINGVKAVEYQCEKSWNKGEGKIGMQIINDPNWREGGKIHFRNIQVRELK